MLLQIFIILLKKAIILSFLFLYKYMVSVNYQNNVKVVQTGGTNRVQTAPSPVTNPIAPVGYQPPAFRNSAYTSVATVKTQLVTDSDKQKYKEISSELDMKYRKKLEYALKSGILLKNESIDKTSVLDNLHKILKEPRDPGLDNKTVLKECLDIIHNPYVITQTCEDIPDEYKTAVLGLVTNMSEDTNMLNAASVDLDNMHTGTCPTASIEFDLATKHPAEFFRMVEGLTSPKNETYKVELINDLEDGSITYYTQGSFTDLCRGPHLPNTEPIKAVKLTSIAGAYWRGDSTKEMLQRILPLNRSRGYGLFREGRYQLFWEYRLRLHQGVQSHDRL